MPDIKAIFFDLDETLVENKLSVTDVFAHMYSDFTDELGDNNQQAFFSELSLSTQRIWGNMFNDERSPERQLIECFEYSIAATQAVAEARHLSLAQDMFDQFLSISSNNVILQDNAEYVLSDLRSLGYTIGIITNGIEQIQLGKIKQLDIQKQVDCITVSAQARVHKPMQPVFDLALQCAEATAQQSMMVGDHPTNDVAGSIRAGFTGVYYNPNQHPIEQAFSELDEKPDHVIHSLPNVLSLLW